MDNRRARNRTASIACQLAVLGLVVYFISHALAERPAAIPASVESYSGTFVHYEHHRGAENLITKNDDTGRYHSFGLGRLGNLIPSAVLVPGQKIEITHIGNDVLTCQVSGVVECRANCLDVDSCHRWEQARDEKSRYFLTVLSHLFAYAALFFALLSFGFHVLARRVSLQS
ncbi:hypothetical protein NLK61_00905 [Pseudomonas fuscovaginae UPB0736]|uniref:hypothetical protein n=1 Tax=Pseudomonas asplenii TaxID=53407 RepID=UPI0012FA1381|nr:hypothetical protein [Pseudomonas fuscovaginae]UUQ65240.1 hypothetical protein NLK61_00905 [Pseudomonas fuscovaginae UPB0736]